MTRIIVVFLVIALQNQVADGREQKNLLRLEEYPDLLVVHTTIPPTGTQEASMKDGKVSNAAAGFWSHPIVLGFILGLVLIGPDHLGTLMALSTLTFGVESFKVVFLWGLGHSLGMIMICPIFYFLKEVGAKKFNVSLEQWEYFGDYFIGASLIVVALYFIMNESRYLVLQADGTYKATGCSCHDSSGNATSTDLTAPEGNHKFCKAYGVYCSPKGDQNRNERKRSRSPFTGRMPDAHGAPCQGIADSAQRPPEVHFENMPKSEETPLVEKTFASTLCRPDLLTLRDVQSAGLGALQGLCCPMGLAGCVFLGHISITSSPMKLIAFATVLVLSSSLGSGGITFAWGALTTRGTGSFLSARVMYRSSCIASFLFGLCWILANAGGVLDSINFADQMNRRIMPVEPTSVGGI